MILCPIYGFPLTTVSHSIPIPTNADPKAHFYGGPINELPPGTSSLPVTQAHSNLLLYPIRYWRKRLPNNNINNLQSSAQLWQQSRQKPLRHIMFIKAQDARQETLWTRLPIRRIFNFAIALVKGDDTVAARSKISRCVCGCHNQQPLQEEEFRGLIGI